MLLPVCPLLVLYSVLAGHLVEAERCFKLRTCLLIKISICSDWKRTIIFIHRNTTPSEYVFLRGGIDHARRPDCVRNNDPCHIPLRHIWTSRWGSKYSAWSQGDNYLDWYGAEQGQGTLPGATAGSPGTPAQGTPMIWTTHERYSRGRWCPPDDFGCRYIYRYDNLIAERDGVGYTPRNKWGYHYWMLDAMMDCSRTEGGWFYLKAYLAPENQWEPDIWQQGTCQRFSQPLPNSRNHMARCGMTNVFQWGQAFPCEIFPNDPHPALPDNY
ncbi:uncharacterized protein LOC106153322 [Lingula anatina]|uniref:Uncharacterized protein LOC106153322 n=1 Tax=Lingula anatina TaxID=7574 RepID=A0A1S3H990_LINAN|nr:uncharacterized protein LOC106153322 [Lingula anatina]|eukprot:XP_013382660.1 uncharacterized protein LOC106153322 [Lingula anatina]